MNSNYKLVVLDIDGTLINDNHEIPKENKEVIKKLQSQGIKFVLATGRNDVLATHFVEELGITPVILGCNGATIRDLEKDILHSHKHIAKEQVSQVYNSLKEYGISAKYFSNSTAYLECHDGCDEHDSFIKRITGKLKIKKFKNPSELLSQDIKMLKIVCEIDDNKLKEISNIIDKIEGLSAFRSGPCCLDIVLADVSKGNAVIEYAKMIGIKPEEIVAIGDSGNDVSMLSMVGYPVTLENGEEQLKKIAKFVTKSNNDAGVAFALKHIFNV